VQNAGWGLLTHVTLPGGGKLGVYQPRHARPEPMAEPMGSTPARPARKAAARKPARPAAKKSGARSARKPAAKKPAKKR
jgi:hypothetical protein